MKYRVLVKDLQFHFCRTKEAHSCIGLDGSIIMKTVHFANREGDQQGEVESMSLFSLAANKSRNLTSARLKEVVFTLVSGADRTRAISSP